MHGSIDFSIFINLSFFLIRNITKCFKSVLRPLKPTNDESPSTVNKPPQQLPAVQPRSSTLKSMSRSMTLSNNDSPPIIESDLSNESHQRRPSMSSSLYSSLASSNNNNNEQKDINNSMESVSSPGPPAVSARIGKAAIGTRVLPMLNPTGDAPAVKLRHFQPEKKGRKQKTY